MCFAEKEGAWQGKEHVPVKLEKVQNCHLSSQRGLLVEQKRERDISLQMYSYFRGDGRVQKISTCSWRRREKLWGGGRRQITGGHELVRVRSERKGGGKSNAARRNVWTREEELCSTAATEGTRRHFEHRVLEVRGRQTQCRLQGVRKLDRLTPTRS